MVAGPIPSSLFYPASGMLLALAMFGVSLTLYIVMAVVRMCIVRCVAAVRGSCGVRTYAARGYVRTTFP